MIPDHQKSTLDEAFADNGLRMTRQRQLVFDVLMESRDHPTADEVYRRVRSRMPSISLATVYNCLEKLVDCSLIRQVNRDRESSRYCGNLQEHGHFYCEVCGVILDIDLPTPTLHQLAPSREAGFRVDSFEINFRGICPKCQTH
jgi:Fur family transcriptional regulator, peroxide stress response regulator